MYEREYVSIERELDVTARSLSLSLRVRCRLREDDDNNNQTLVLGESKNEVKWIILSSELVRL